jgi:hypothetical protein
LTPPIALMLLMLISGFQFWSYPRRLSVPPVVYV